MALADKRNNLRYTYIERWAVYIDVYMYWLQDSPVPMIDCLIFLFVSNTRLNGLTNGAQSFCRALYYWNYGRSKVSISKIILQILLFFFSNFSLKPLIIKNLDKLTKKERSFLMYIFHVFFRYSIFILIRRFEIKFRFLSVIILQYQGAGSKYFYFYFYTSTEVSKFSSLNNWINNWYGDWLIWWYKGWDFREDRTEFI